MVAFIKRRKDFKTVASSEVVSYDVPLASIADDVGTILLYDTAVTRGNEGDFLIMDGHIWLIDQVTPDEMQTSVTVTDIAGAFDRSLPYEGESESIGTFLAQQFIDHYRDVSDLNYQMPYLEITNLDNTEYLGPTVVDGLFDLRTYMRKVNRLRDVQVHFSVSKDKLCILIAPRQRPSHNILFGDGTSQLISRSYSRSSIAKVTAYQLGIGHTYYLSADGKISQEEPVFRAEGKWQVLALEDTEDLNEKVQDIFSQNSNSHKIEWKSTKAYELYDTVVLRLDGGLMTSYVSYIGISSADHRYYYKSGELATTLTERLKGANL